MATWINNWIGSPEYHAYKAIERRLRATPSERVAQVARATVVVIAAIVFGR